MKKVIAIAFTGGLILASCSKKETATESNTMLSEPETTMTDTNNTVTMDSTAVVSPVVTDSTLVK